MVIGVDAGGHAGGETHEVLQAFAEQSGVTFPLVWDSGTHSLWDWPPGTAPFPRQAILDRDGRATWVASEHEGQALQHAIETALAAE